MGEVYLAEDPPNSRQVAIKVMKSEELLYVNTQEAQEAERLFKREMRAIAKLDHSNILALYGSGKQVYNREQINYMVMPYCPAGSLADWIKQYHADSLLTPQEISQLLTQAAAGLQHAHEQNILHLDIKPQNFLVRRQKNPKALPTNLLLADFGVAKITDTTKMSSTARGTYQYMAPEQIGNKPVPASDQYALAIMVYELLTGRTPFEGARPEVLPHLHAKVMPEPPSKVNPSLPQVLDSVILRALAKKPEKRYCSVTEFAQAFAATLEQGRKSPRIPRSLQQSSARWGEFWWTLLLFGVIAGLVYVVGRWYLGWDLRLYTYLYRYLHLEGYLRLALARVISRAIPIILSGFIVGKMVRRKWAGTLTGVIAGMTVVVMGTIIPYPYPQEYLRFEVIFGIGGGTVLGFIGAWIASWGTKWGH